MFPTRYDVTDNICLYTVNTNKFKASTLSFSITLPSTPWLRVCLTLLAGLMHRGTCKYPSQAKLNRALDELYGSYLEIKSRRIGSNITFSVGCELLDNKYVPDGTDVAGGIIDIVSDLLLHPLAFTTGLPSDVLEKEKRIFRDNLNSIRDNTRTYASVKCTELLYRSSKTEPTVAELGETLEKVSYEDVKNTYFQLLNTSPIEVFYVGDMKTEELAQRIKAAFGGFALSKKADIIPIAPHISEKYIFECEPFPVCQSKLSLALNTGIVVSPKSKSYYTALVFNEIFGGSPASKLFLNVREKMGLCYYCSSSYSIYSGIIKISSGIEADKLNTVTQAILDELDGIRRGEITLYELEAAKKSLINSYLQLYDSPFDLQSFYQSRALFSIDDGIEECREGILAVTVPEIISLAQSTTLDAAFFVEGIGGNTEDSDE